MGQPQLGSRRRIKTSKGGHPPQSYRVTEKTIEERTRFRLCLFSHAFAGLAREVLRDQRPGPHGLASS